MVMGGSEFGDVDVYVLRAVASPNVTVLAAVASWFGAVFLSIVEKYLLN